VRILYKEEGNGFLGLSRDEVLDIFVMHVDLHIWSTSEYKRYLVIFRNVLKLLREVGITEVYSFCDSKKEKKFNRLFGFVDTGFTGLDENGIESSILKLEI
jgi:hypothetical protein